MIRPGFIVFERIPLPASSKAHCREKASIAAFDAEYKPNALALAKFDATEEIKTSELFFIKFPCFDQFSSQQHIAEGVYSECFQ